MAKTMKAAAPGALIEVLKANRLTMTDLSKKGQFSRNTLRDINAGKPVKSDTLDSVAKRLAVPVEHLLPKEPAALPPSGQESTGVLADSARRPSPMERALAGEVVERRLTSDGLLVKAIRPEDIELDLEWVFRITWTVDPKTPREAHPVIRELGTALAAVTSAAAAPDGEEGLGSLERQLRDIEAWDEVKTKMARLEELGVHLLTGSYLYWTHKTYETDPYGEGPTGDEFCPEMTAHLHVSPITTKSERVLVHEGRKPPQFSPQRGPSVYVNGRELPREPVTPPVNDDPPADAANDDDDMPF